VHVGIKAGNPWERAALAAGQVPEPLFEAYLALMMARSIIAGTELGIFDALAEKTDDAAGLAFRLGLDERGVDVLLLALHAQGYLDAADGGYRPSRRTRRTLLPGGARSTRAWMHFGPDMWEAFTGLEAQIRGDAAQDIHDKAPEDPYWERYMRGLFELSKLTRADVARAIGAGSPRRMLDIAGGHAGFAMALCDRHEGLQATIADLEGAARIGREIVAEEGYADRINFRVGDVFEGDLDGPYDLVTAFSIVHHFTPERNIELLRRARAALRPGGRMAVFELERPAGDDRGTQLGTLTGVLFYLTSGGRTYTGEEIAAFFTEAGYVDVRVKHLLRAPGNQLVLGDNPG
jgi:ubiquinone/menaquinone biosynthesis C-methylase UbiE